MEVHKYLVNSTKISDLRLSHKSDPILRRVSAIKVLHSLQTPYVGLKLYDHSSRELPDINLEAHIQLRYMIGVWPVSSDDYL